MPVSQSRKVRRPHHHHGLQGSARFTQPKANGKKHGAGSNPQRAKRNIERRGRRRRKQRSQFESFGRNGGKARRRWDDSRRPNRYDGPLLRRLLRQSRVVCLLAGGATGRALVVGRHPRGDAGGIAAKLALMATGEGARMAMPARRLPRLVFAIPCRSADAHAGRQEQRIGDQEQDDPSKHDDPLPEGTMALSDVYPLY